MATTAVCVCVYGKLRAFNNVRFVIACARFRWKFTSPVSLPDPPSVRVLVRVISIRCCSDVSTRILLPHTSNPLAKVRNHDWQCFLRVCVLCLCVFVQEDECTACRVYNCTRVRYALKVLLIFFSFAARIAACMSFCFFLHL